MYLLKASMTNIPYDPILHDLSISPRNMTSAEIVQYWLGDLSLFLSKITGWKFQICFSSRMLHNGTKLSKLLMFPAFSSHFLAYLATFWCWSLVTTQLWQLQSPSWVKTFTLHISLTFDLPRFTWCWWWNEGFYIWTLSSIIRGTYWSHWIDSFRKGRIIGEYNWNSD